MIDCKPCDAQCCKQIVRIISWVALSKLPDEIKREYLDFPHSITEKGVCEKLGKDNKCTIFDERPIICNSERFHAKYYEKYGDYTDFKVYIEDGCRILKRGK